jgi:antitoxin (DNA-binding transcriptional repressor) of toxin-antitoxin stability system
MGFWFVAQARPKRRQWSSTQCDARTYHIIRKASVRDLGYHLREIESWLKKGEEIEIHKRKKVIARLSPVGPKPENCPDFAANRRRIFGKRETPTTGTELVSEQRGGY